jgi:hypothetical protein
MGRAGPWRRPLGAGYRARYSNSNILWSGLDRTTTTTIAPVAVLALQRAGLPWWLGAWGAVAFAEQAVETIMIFGSTGFTQPGGAMNWQVGGGLTVGWMLAFAFCGGLRGRVQISAA